MTSDHHAQEIQMLRSEIEMLMNERQSLLRATGAAAVFVETSTASPCPRVPTRLRMSSRMH